MESSGATQWSSIIVPSVQEMVKEKIITTVPARYVRSDQDKAAIAGDSGLKSEIPVIDMNHLCSSAFMDSEIDKLDVPCKIQNTCLVLPALYYPPCPEPDKVFGLSPHSDSTGLTILLQVNEVDGLQIKKNGEWVSVKPLPNAFLVNVGDILEIIRFITNGTYRSIEHRGVVNSEKERISVATFHNMGMGKQIGPMKSLVERHKASFYKPVTAEKYFSGLFSRPLDGKAYLDVMRI